MNRWIVLTLAVSLIALSGCENPQLKQCLQDNQSLTAQLQQAKQELADTQAKAENLQAKTDKMKTEFDEVQTKAMKGIQNMLEKQAEKTKEQLAAKDAVIAELKTRIKQLENKTPEAEPASTPAVQ